MGGRKPAAADGATDEALMAAARRGDVEAFGALVRRFQDRMFTVALRLTRNRATAEDMAQQALLRAWQGRHAYDSRWRVSTWLYRIVTNQCMDEHRRRARAASLPPGAAPSRVAHPYRALEERETRSRLNGALRGLPRGQQAVMVLRYLDDLPYAEIGRICGLPVNTVKSHLRRAKAALRKELIAWRES